MSVATPEPDELEWMYLQSFGDENSSDEDLVTTVAFDATGDYLAVGDKAGRVCIFNCTTSRPLQASRSAGIVVHPDIRLDDEGASLDEYKIGIPPASRAKYIPPGVYPQHRPVEYKFFFEFQSHEADFDCLKNVTIDEKINMIQWCPPTNNALFFLSTNDKTIKLWKVHARYPRFPLRGPSSPNNTYGELVVPKLQTGSAPTTIASKKRVYAGGHQHVINSIAACSDDATFLSADECVIHQWSLDSNQETYNIVDMKPPSTEELTEVITTLSCHPTAPHMFIYGSSRGAVRQVDMRDFALYDPARSDNPFQMDEDPATRSFFTDIVSSITSCKYTPDGQFIIARDYLTVKVWDVRSNAKPVAVVPVHDYLRLHLCDLYETECIFDRFTVDISPDGTQFVTGSYSHHFIIHNLKTQQTINVEAPKNARARPKTKSLKRQSQKREKRTDVPSVKDMDFYIKGLHCSWHPKLDSIAIACTKKLYVYQGFLPSKDI